MYVLLAALRGMNVGGSDPETSGEHRALVQVVTNLRSQEGVIIVFDVGANVGGWSEMAASAFGERAVVHAFEPAPDAYASLAARVAHLPHVKTHPLGLGATNETRMLMRPNSADVSTSARGSLHSRGYERDEQAVESFPVELKSLATILETEKIENVHFLKLDVEGHELQILGAAKDALAMGRIGFIQFEYGMQTLAAGGFLKDFFDVLEPTHRIHRILPSGLHPIDEWKPFLEIPVCTNYLAVPRGV